ncbi:MAG: hypothetical protein FWF43_05880 [Propionibacteriaceae bacterium]|nr:hypothetical protein [Propionibacteriaceae bacterium]
MSEIGAASRDQDRRVVASTRPAVARSVLAAETANAKLMLLRGLTHRFESELSQTYPDHLARVVGVRTPPLYRSAYDRWRTLIQSSPGVIFTAIADAPLTIGLGSSSPIEAGIALHHTYGVPYLPGSALKGLARQSVSAFPDLTDEHRRIIFGDDSPGNTRAQGYVTFWDGWLDSGMMAPLQQDVITVHHSEYYRTSTDVLRADRSRGLVQGKTPEPPERMSKTSEPPERKTKTPETSTRSTKSPESVMRPNEVSTPPTSQYAPVIPPTDFDDPNPIPFLSVHTHTKFHVAITCQATPPELATQWAQTAAMILQYGLTHVGLGAKTNSGYGIFRVDPNQAEILGGGRAL